MPAKNTIRSFKEDGIYHIYNRGLAKRDIFSSSDDYQTFLYYLSTYLLNPEKTLQKYPNTPKRTHSKSLYQEIELISYCLMPNHFHLLLKTKNETAVSKLLKQLTNAYTLYFNKRYDHTGPLFQGVYRCVEVEESQIMQILRHIHLNPVTAFLVEKPKDYKWSSHNEYLKEKFDLCKAEGILNNFTSVAEWEKFILDQRDYSQSLTQIQHLTLER
jgi:putative transposase